MSSSRSQCGKCRSTTKKDGLVGCEGACGKWFHHSCVNFSESDFKLLERNKNLFFLCDVCKIDCVVLQKDVLSQMNDKIGALSCGVDSVSARVDKLVGSDLQTVIDERLEALKRDLILSFNSHVDNLKNSFPSSDFPGNSSSGSGPTYAGAVRGSTSVFIEPKDAKQDVAVTKSDILRIVDPLNSSVSVTGSKSTRTGGLIVRCDTKQDVERLSAMTTDSLSDRYTVRLLPSWKPRLRIVGVSREDVLKGDQASKYIVSQNKNLFHPGSSCELLHSAPLKNQKSKHSIVYQATIQVDALSYRRILECGRLIVGLDSCAVYDAVEIKRCFRCCGFHHFAKSCTQRKSVCPKCGGEHDVAACESQVLSCINCCRLKSRPSGDAVRTDHATWNTSECPAYKAALADFKREFLGFS